MARRLQFILLGLLAGIAFWQLSELPFTVQETRAFAAVAVLALSFFGGTLGMLGELGLRRALIAALAIAVPAAALTLLASHRFADVEQMLRTGHIAVALSVVMVLPVPFAIALAKKGRDGWKDYACLFSESWNLVVRYAAAWLFVAVLWLVLWLLWSLLELVGIEAVGRFLTRAPVVWLVSGAATGLALAVVTELPDMISPYLLLRLARLLLPLVLLVEVVFVAVLPASGLGHLFGYISPAGILVATALASILLVTIAVDENDEEAARGRILTWSARGLALLLPVLVALAGWALSLRVGALGWTPPRIGTAVMIALIGGYALCYAGAVLRGADWRARLRRANIGMALVVIAVGALWLTPLLSAEALSVRSQMARYADGRLPADRLPVWEFAHEWGRPGERAVARLRQRADRPGEEALARRLAVLDRAQSRGDAAAEGQPSIAARAEELRGVIPVLPAGETLPDGLLTAIARASEADWAQGCMQRTAGGNPACLAVVGDFDPRRPGRDALFLRQEGFGTVLAFQERGARWIGARPVFLGAGVPPSGGALIDALVAGGGATAPAELQALPLGSRQLTILP
ncbi:DUF4153 domain-containing protein [Paenirhodobacter populi]|uniref:DUF4153 domain-containing protein n=1 Tax=Paenirhodobacter populi TaxID=2306993 RepID=A0A451GCF8_9RHOB|nr:DUF4153 domain-containing protein [Sinirhodobacter populi]RWR12980.1 DUF4153 domain-containing protein [Sinirhodobacter populi]